MPRIAIYFLEFDDDNVDHLGRHGIGPEEIEQVTGNAYVTTRNAREPANRILMIGQTDGGRVLTVVLEATRDDVVWRPVTGWDSTPEERRLLTGN
ncbi:MAG: BrnT family toxin [Solirubrobacteraceae bacterium]